MNILSPAFLTDFYLCGDSSFKPQAYILKKLEPCMLEIDRRRLVVCLNITSVKIVSGIKYLGSSDDSKITKQAPM